MLIWNLWTTDSLERKIYIIAMVLDFSKAFDTDGHIIILSILEHIAIRGADSQWFKSYLSGKQNIVHFGNKVSKASDMLWEYPRVFFSVLSYLTFMWATRQNH